ncbi:MAG: 2,3-bisphosphoglycerate-independent phosphoglycerate mutase [Candidatus Limnocylindrales bacterium]
MTEDRPRPIVLVVLDGFGLGDRPEADAIAAARLPGWRALLATWPHSRLAASGEAVGLPAGQMGNSEVGHLNLGAGRAVLQDLPRIDAAVADGSFAANDALLTACQRAAAPGGRLHLVSLIGPGGVHAVDRHLVAAAAMACQAGDRDVVVHAILDGRDTPPRSAVGYMHDLEVRLGAACPAARVATVAGRYYTMDRDRRWDRLARGYHAIVEGRGEHAASAVAAIEEAYGRGEDDEFVAPTVVSDVDGRVRPGDALVFLNFRADRARELTHALIDEPFSDFERGPRPADLLVVTMTEYEDGLPVAVAFPPLVVPSLASYFAELGWRQFHVAETEKYAHVTYFFNGGVEAAWPGEERRLIPSARVATYDLEPAMRAPAIAAALVEAIETERYDFLVANFANADMVGHTGHLAATVAAVEVLDDCLDRVAWATLAVDAARRAAGGRGALLCVTADHGNADEMRDMAGRPVTAHSLNPVPLLLAGSVVRGATLRDGVLADVGPTLLARAGLPPLPGMTGHDLLTAATA